MGLGLIRGSSGGEVKKWWRKKPLESGKRVEVESVNI